MTKMIKYMVFFSGVLFSLAASAKGDKPLVFSDVEITRVCWFGGAQYSEGAIIEMRQQARVCAPKYKYQPESALVWLPLGEDGRPAYPPEEKTIQVR